MGGLDSSAVVRGGPTGSSSSSLAEWKLSFSLRRTGESTGVWS